MVSAFAQTVIASLAVSSSYVFAIYLGVSNPQLVNRNDPSVIKRRMQRVSLMTLIDLFLVPVILVDIIGTYPTYSKAIETMGLVPGFHGGEFQLSSLITALGDTIRALFLFMILFVGPIIEEISWFVYPKLDLDFLRQETTEYLSPTNRIRVIRDLIFAPMSEEIVYTSYKMALFLPFIYSGELSVVKLILISPSLFGIAHIHHGFVLYHTTFQRRLIPVILNVAFQFIYTSLFGMITGFVFLRTGTVWSCFVSHCFCNFMGFPTLVPQGNKLDWKIFYWCLLILGSVCFKKYLWTLTESTNALI